jgi:hypothetical protein
MMDTLRGTLLYAPQKDPPIQILTDSRVIDLWPLIEPTFWSLCGLYVEHGTEDTFSYALSLSQEQKPKMVFDYRSREKMFLFQPGKSGYFDVALYFDLLLCVLHKRKVVVEADREHFKISATARE